jgi:hypothetical protein
MMALKAAQQETEGYEGVKNAITGGMDASDPRMLQFGKRGIEAFKAAGEGRVKQQDALTKAYLNQRKSLDFVSSPDDLLAHGLSQFNDPVIAPQLKAQGLTPEKLTASFQKQLATEGFESLLKKRAMGLDDWYKDQTSRRNTDVSSGASYGQLELSKKKDAREQAVFDLIQNALTGKEPPSAAAPVTGGVPMGGGSGPAAAPVAGIPASTNVLRDQVAPQGGAAPVSSVGVNNLTAQPSVVAPVTSPTTAPAALTKDEQVKEIDLKIEKLSMIPDPRAKSAVEMLLKRREILEPTKGPLVNINMPEDRKSFEMKVGPEGTKFAYKGLEKAQNAAEIINNVNVGKSILDKGMISGFGANFLVGLNQALKTGGIDFGYADASANSQAYAAAMAQNVGKLITLFGAGTGLSDADRAYAEQMAAGKINLDEAALRKILRINEDVSRRGIESHNKKMKQMGAPEYLQVEIPFEPPADIKDLWPYMTPEDKLLWQK